MKLTLEFWKGLFMAAFGVLAASLSTQPIVWAVVGITILGTILTYVGKNAITALQSTTGPGTLSFVNIISGVLIALGSGITEAVATLVTAGHVQWLVLGKIVITVTMSYLTATFFAGPNTAAVASGAAAPKV